MTDKQYLLAPIADLKEKLVKIDGKIRESARLVNSETRAAHKHVIQFEHLKQQRLQLLDGYSAYFQIADWMEQNGETDHANLVRLECQLAEICMPRSVSITENRISRGGERFPEGWKLIEDYGFKCPHVNVGASVTVFARLKEAKAAAERKYGSITWEEKFRIYLATFKSKRDALEAQAVDLRKKITSPTITGCEFFYPDASFGSSYWNLGFIYSVDLYVARNDNGSYLGNNHPITSLRLFSSDVGESLIESIEPVVASMPFLKSIWMPSLSRLDNMEVLQVGDRSLKVLHR